MSGVLVSLNGRTESQATIISSDVTGALGYTPVESVAGSTGSTITAAQIASAIGALVSRNQSVSSVTSTTGVTLTAAEMVGGWILRQGSATSALTDTTDTAANLVAAYNSNDTQVNSSFLMGISNNTGQTLTIAAGAGVTLTGSMSIQPNNTRVFLGVFTDVTSGSQAVTLTNLFSAGI